MNSKELKFTFLTFLTLVLLSCGDKSAEDVVETLQSDEISSAIGDSTISDEVTTPEPVVTLVPISLINQPVDGSYGEGAELIFQVIFEEVVVITGTPRILLNIGGTNVNASYTQGSGTNGIEFKYTIVTGLSDTDGIALSSGNIDLNRGSIIGSSENNANLNLLDTLGSLNSVLVNASLTPPDKVIGVTTAPSTDNTSLGVTWTVPSDNGTTIENYSIQYRKQGTSSWINATSTINSKKLTGLESGITYQIRVASNNGVLGAYSTIVTTEIFDILSLSPIAWLSATDVTNGGTEPSNGDKVDQWEDLTGLATAAVESNEAKQPVYHTNVFNGLPAIRFDNLDRGLEGTFNRANNEGLTIITVGKMDTNNSRKCFFEFYQDGSGDAGTTARRGFFFTHGYNSATVNYNLDDTTFNIWTATDTGTKSSQWENGTNLYTEINNYFPRTDFLGSGVYVLGDDKTGGDRLNGYIGEFLVFDKILTDEERTKVETYLENKWGL